jgi:hypothetical protein
MLKLNKYRITKKFWFLVLVSSLWFVVLAAGGLLDVKPLWFRIALIPILGVPMGIFYVQDLVNESNKISLGVYVATVLFAGPVLSVICGIPLAAAIYFILELFGISFGP